MSSLIPAGSKVAAVAIAVAGDVVTSVVAAVVAEVASSSSLLSTSFFIITLRHFCE